MKLNDSPRLNTPAALMAALSGNAENFHAASTPGGIEAQEKRGQLRQAKLQQLPREMGRNGQYKVELEKLGFVFGENVDALFVEAKFPDGWSIKPTDHSMHSDLVDNLGRKRGGIFYKAAFYDQRASLNLIPRFSVATDYAKKGEETESVRVNDECGKVSKRIDNLAVSNWSVEREVAQKNAQKMDAAKAELIAWLTENYPDWQSVSAYWND